MKAKSWIAFFVTGLALLLAGCAGAISQPQAASADPIKAQVTVLYDAFGKPSAMQKDWGYSVFIEAGRTGGQMLIVDAQVHIWAADTPDRPWPSIGHSYAHRETPLGKDALLREMDAAGVNPVTASRRAGAGSSSHSIS